MKPTLPKCILCGSSNFRKIAEGHDRLEENATRVFSVVKCLQCGLASTKPKLSLEDLSKHYPPSYPIYEENQIDVGGHSLNAALASAIKADSGIMKQLKDLIARARYRYITSPNLPISLLNLLLLPFRIVLGPILPFGKNAGTILDIGCGKGNYLLSAYIQGWKCHGVEIKEGLANSLIDTGIAEIFYGPFENYSAPPNSFDQVYMSHVLEHFVDPISNLRKAHQLLIPDGILIINIPVVSGFEIRVFRRYWHGWELPRHQYHFGDSSARMILEKSNFKVLKLTYHINPNNIIWSTKYWLEDTVPKWSKYLTPRNLLIKVLLLPIGLLEKLLKQSGRITIYASPAQSDNEWN